MRRSTRNFQARETLMWTVLPPNKASILAEIMLCGAPYRLPRLSHKNEHPCHLSGNFPILFAADLFSFCHFAMRLPSVQVQVLGRTLACFAGSSRHEQLWRSRSRDNSQLLNLKASSLHHPTKENQGNAWDADMNAR